MENVINKEQNTFWGMSHFFIESRSGHSIRYIYTPKILRYMQDRGGVGVLPVYRYFLSFFKNHIYLFFGFELFQSTNKNKNVILYSLNKINN